MLIVKWTLVLGVNDPLTRIENNCSYGLMLCDHSKQQYFLTPSPSTSPKASACEKWLPEKSSSTRSTKDTERISANGIAILYRHAHKLTPGAGVGKCLCATRSLTTVNSTYFRGRGIFVSTRLSSRTARACCSLLWPVSQRRVATVAVLFSASHDGVPAAEPAGVVCPQGATAVLFAPRPTPAREKALAIRWCVSISGPIWGKKAGLLEFKDSR